MQRKICSLLKWLLVATPIAAVAWQISAKGLDPPYRLRLKSVHVAREVGAQS